MGGNRANDKSFLVTSIRRAVGLVARASGQRKFAFNGVDSQDTDDKVFLLDAATVISLTDQLGKDFLRARGKEFAKTKNALKLVNDNASIYFHI